MLGVERFTIISGGANGVDLEAERFARDFWFTCQDPNSTLASTKQILAPVNASAVGRSHSNHKPSLQSPQQTIKQSHQFTVHSPELSCGETSRNGTGFYKLSTWKWPMLWKYRLDSGNG